MRALAVCWLAIGAIFTQQVIAADKAAAIARVPFSSTVDDGGSRGDDVDASPSFPLQLIVNSFLNGSVQFNFASSSVGVPPATASVTITGVDISGPSIFDEFGDYVFVQPQQAGVAQLRTGSYSVSVSPNLTPAEPGLGTACDFVSGTEVTVGTDGSVTPASVEIKCGTPTKKLAPSLLAEIQAVGLVFPPSDNFTGLPLEQELKPLPPVLAGSELFSVCLGNGGSNTIFGYPNVPTSDIGTGLRFVEDVLELPALIASNGEGITLYCRIMGESATTDSVVDEPMWVYLVRLDILKVLDLAGGTQSPSAGDYDNEEIISLLTPYQSLIDGSSIPYGVLPGTPTRRLQLLEFSINSFNTSRWSDLWRISTTNNYEVGDTRTTSNTGVIYSFGIQIDVSPTALDLINALQISPLARIEPFGDDPNGDGITSILEFPLNQQTALIFGPFDLGAVEQDPLALRMLNVPPTVACTADGFTLENGLSNAFNGTNYRPYGASQPLTIQCDERIQNNRVAVTVAFPDIQSSAFPTYDGKVRILLYDSSNTEIHSEVVTRSTARPEFFFSLNNLEDGTYRLETLLIDKTVPKAFGCDSGGVAKFVIDQGDVELGVIQCSETTSVTSIGSGLMANCLRANNIGLLHELSLLPSDSELDCSGLAGAEDFDLLRQPFGARTLNLNNTNLAVEDLMQARHQQIRSGHLLEVAYRRQSWT